jgi:hypothetical protein
MNASTATGVVVIEFLIAALKDRILNVLPAGTTQALVPATV